MLGHPIERRSRLFSTGEGSDNDAETERARSPSDRQTIQTDSTDPVSGEEEEVEAAPIIPYWSAKRHLTCGNPQPRSARANKIYPWRGSSPGKLKTATAALVLCLNIDVDPPDIIKTNPCATLECWVDPQTMPSNKALEAIGTNLQHQFEGLSQKIPYKPILDPSFEDLRRFCVALRRQAKEDTILFYYNGHGVPKPTSSGELWCFNRNYTQYIPVSLQEVQGWLGSPGVYIWDCSAAGNLLNNFNTFADKRDQETFMLHGGYTDGQQPYMNSLQLAACGANEQLPSCPELPADVFTSCLTSPIDIALRFFVMNNDLPTNISVDMVMQLPGDLKDRRTPLGELNWIFTAITDTIAWTTFPRDVFTRLYRSDLLIASLFRNFLLAERILKNYQCTPMTHPPLPPTNTHPMWQAWDLAVDTCLRQLPDLLGVHNEVATPPSSLSGGQFIKPRRLANTARPDKSGTTINSSKSTSVPYSDKPYQYIPSRFFADQLSAFEVWISRGGSALTKRGPYSLPKGGGDRFPGVDGLDEDDIKKGDEEDHDKLVPRKPPDQLPIILQVLLSQPHRLRALILLSRFVDLGPWAVHLVLNIGIFPYISKLLQAAGQDLRPVMIFIWTRILAVDPSVQTDLYNTNGYKYFATVLSIQDEQLHPTLPNNSEHKAMCAFILSAIARDYPLGQAACWRERVFDHCFDRLNADDFLLRQWTALCIAQIWDGNDEIKIYGVDRGTQDALIALLSDDSVEVRTAALYALGTFMGASGSADPNKPGGGGSGTMFQLEERIHFRMEVAVVTGATLGVKDDASPMIRKDLLVLISCLVKEWRGNFVVCAWLYWEEDRRWKTGPPPQPNDEELTSQAVADWLDGFGDDEGAREENRVLLSSFFTIFVVLLELSVDSYHEVASNAQTIVDYIVALLLESPFTRLEGTSLHTSLTNGYYNGRVRVPSLQSISPQPPPSPNLLRPGITRSETMTSTITSGVTNTIRRTSSFANVLKHLAGNIAFPSAEDGRKSPATPTIGSSHQGLLDVSRPPSPNLNIAQYTSPYSRPPTPNGTLHVEESLEDSPRLANEQPQPTMDFLPCDVMEALMEEDMERLRARRRAGGNTNKRRPHHHHHHHGDALASPSGSTFSVDSNGSSVILGLGTGSGIRDVLPLKSTYYDWCAEYFTEPQMRQTEVDEPGSLQYNYQVWRQQRNENVLRETRTQAQVAQSCKWDRPVATIQVPGHPLSMAFHSYDHHLVVANEADTISVWDWSQRKLLSQFYNGNPKGTSITSLQIINEDVGGIIMAGASDGRVSLYRNYDPSQEQGPVQMVSSFRGLAELVRVRRGSGIVLDWKQIGGTLLVGGDSRVIRVWDAHTETHTMDFVTEVDSPVTCLASDQASPWTFAAGFGTGEVKIFDKRMDDENVCVRVYTDHTTWVQNVRWHPTLGAQILSAGLDGEIKLFDLRGHDTTPVQTWNMGFKGLSAFDVHPNTPVFAASAAVTPNAWKTQRTALHPLGSREPLTMFNIPTGLAAYPLRSSPSLFIPRSTSLVFHPAEMLYGVGTPDGTVRILGCKLVPTVLLDDV